MAPVVVPERVPRRDSAFGRWLGRTVHAAWGWKIEGELPNAPKFVIALAPHTSNWDFIFGAATMLSSLGMSIGPVAGGWVYDTYHNYAWLYIASAAVAVGAVLLATTFPKPVPVRMPVLP